MHPHLRQDETPVGTDEFIDLLGVILPVGRNMKSAARHDFSGQQLQKSTLKNASLVMTLLWPRVRKVQVNATKRSVRNLLLYHFNSVVLNQAQIRDASSFGVQQAVTYARFVNFDADEVRARAGCRLFDQRLAVAEADLKDSWCGTAENRIEFQRLFGIQDTERRPKLPQCAFL